MQSHGRQSCVYTLPNSSVLQGQDFFVTSIAEHNQGQITIPLQSTWHNLLEINIHRFSIHLNDTVKI